VTDPHNTPAPLIYKGEVISQRGEMLSLTDMWSASGRDEAKRPANWARKDGRSFVEYAEVALNMPRGHIIRAGRGRQGETAAHWQVALAYAKYLSPEFHMWCNTVVRERMEGKSVSIANLPPDVVDLIRRTDGIARMLSHKVTEMEKALPVIARQAMNDAIASDPRRAVLDYVSVRQLLEEAGAEQRSRRRVNRKLGIALRNRALMEGEIGRRCPHSGVWLFPRGFAAKCMKDFGNTMVRDHNDAVRGQTALRLVQGRHDPQVAS
jgi:hypothetical protein